MITEQTQLGTNGDSARPLDILGEIPVEAVFIPDGRKRRFDPKDQRSVDFKESVRKSGVIHPICVRQAGERFELICGRKRLWAAKELKLATIPARIGYWRDDELEFLRICENLQREHANEVEQAKMIKIMFEEYTRIFGRDPSRTISGHASFVGAVVDPETGRFKRRDKGTEKTPADSSTSPLMDTASDSGAPTFSESGTTVGGPRTHASMISEATGLSEHHVRVSRKQTGHLTVDELTALANTPGVTGKDLKRLGAIKEPSERRSAVNLVCIGQTVDNAIKESTADTPENQEIRERMKEKDAPDSKWLTHYCPRPIKLLEKPDVFKREALMWRYAHESLQVFRARTRERIEEVMGMGPGPLAKIFHKMLYLKRPNDWIICADCMGLNKQVPACKTCGGAGYILAFNYPEPKAKKTQVQSAPVDF